MLDLDHCYIQTPVAVLDNKPTLTWISLDPHPNSLFTVHCTMHVRVFG